MKGLRTMLLLGLPALVLGQEPTAPSMLRFSNQDQIPGSLESLTSDQVVWDSPIQMKPTAFWLKEVVDLTLSAETPLFQASHEATLTLARGDSLKGQLAGVTEDSIELDTWYAGRMKFPRVMVRDVIIADRPELLYRGPSSAEGWVQSASPAVWKFNAASLRSSGSGSIGRDVNLPDEFRMAYEVEWRNSLAMSVIFFSDDLTTEKPENGYEMTFQRRSVRLQRCGNHNWIGSTQSATELQENEKARIEIRASMRTKTICFYINDRIVEVWTDPQMEPGPFGRGIQFATQDNSPIKISGIEVAKWDGVIEETPIPENRPVIRFRNEDGAVAVPEKAPDTNRMMLRNGDSIAGEVVAIADGILTLKTAYREIRFPVSRLKAIPMKSPNLEEPKRMIGDVRGWFLDGTSVVFRLDQVDGESITGFSQNFGSAKFNLKAFMRLEFNLYNPQLTELREGDDWQAD